MPVPEPPHPDVQIRELGRASQRTDQALHDVARANYQALNTAIGNAQTAAQQGDQSLYSQIQALAQRVGTLEQQMGQALNQYPISNPFALIPTNWGPPARWTWHPGNGTVSTSTGLTLYLASRVS